jgi:hypothetical protein
MFMSYLQQQLIDEYLNGNSSLLISISHFNQLITLHATVRIGNSYADGTFQTARIIFRDLFAPRYAQTFIRIAGRTWRRAVFYLKTPYLCFNEEPWPRYDMLIISIIYLPSIYWCYRWMGINSRNKIVSNINALVITPKYSKYFIR